MKQSSLVLGIASLSLAFLFYLHYIVHPASNTDGDQSFNDNDVRRLITLLQNQNKTIHQLQQLLLIKNPASKAIIDKDLEIKRLQERI